jgi:hypothetical protein
LHFELTNKIMKTIEVTDRAAQLISEFRTEYVLNLKSTIVDAISKANELAILNDNGCSDYSPINGLASYNDLINELSLEKD